jgi:oxygen-independent coproporphyrinogen-3 oxidase
VRLPDDAETTVECDPRRTGRLQLSLLRGLGLRHVVFGVLDLDPQVQRAICRLHSAELIDDACRLARDCGFELIDLGLMIGLPRQTEASWRATIERVIEIAPDRITLSHYRHWPHFAPAQQAIDPLALPDPAACQAQATLTVELLCGAGYRWLGNDQFVLDDDPLALAQAEGQLRRNLISYTATPPTQLLGLGAGAVSEIDGHLFWNEPGVQPWLEAAKNGRWAISHAQEASPRESRRRAAVEHLFCRLELPAALARDGLEDLYASLSAHQDSGLVRVDDDRIVMTDSGRHAMTMLCPHLDRPSRLASAVSSSPA